MRVSFFIPPVFLLIMLLGSSSAWATAEGPDCWAVHGVAENDVLNIRSGPSPRYKVIGKIPADARSVANANDIECPDAWTPKMPPECGSRWCRVTYNAVTGWVNCRFLEESVDCPGRASTPESAGEAPGLPLIVPKGCEGESCTPWETGKFHLNRPLKIYSGPFGTNKILFTIPPEQEFTIVRSNLYTIKAAPYRLTDQDIQNGKCECPYNKCQSSDPLKTGSLVYILSYDGEGYYRALYGSQEYYCSFHEDSEKIDGKLETVRVSEVAYKGRRGWWRLPGACRGMAFLRNMAFQSECSDSQ